MSYQYKRADVVVVVCDVCGDFSWIGDRHWRVAPHSTIDQPIHLCKSCQRLAMWCPAHQQYHRPDAFHRCACVDCGGLFTSTVRDEIIRCPSCRRVMGDNPVRTAPVDIERPRSLVQMLFSPRTSHRQ
jgi:hypothetical protein